MFWGTNPPLCMESGDIKKDGFIDIVDPVTLFVYLFRDGAPPPSPFPAPGPSSGSAQVPCDSYGGGSALPDDAAEMRIVDAVAAGGDDGAAMIRVEVSSSAPIA